ncbi:MAG: beta-ketoacyl-ACP synthase II [Anaerolineaceae bacterium]|nr:beta-ketoacyl-ACP synthase II [Anaerolineaceae bacterium]MCB9099094.1 beta-ketoacyl-ACP synthase II [Anaerolineales bacterium]
MNRRVVVTGMGAVTPVGNTVEEAWNNLKAGVSGIAPITNFDTSDFEINFAGEVKNFDASALFGKKEARRLDRYTHFAMESSRQAIEDSGLLKNGTDRSRVGLVIGSCVGGLSSVLEQHEVLQTKGPSRVNPFTISMMLPDTAPARIAIDYNLTGPNMAVVTACATGTDTLGEAFEIIRRGDADAIIAGGSEAVINPLIMASFQVMKAISPNNDNPAGACRPFDLNRDGFVMSEGSVVLVLEELEHAQKRHASILAEVIGYGTCVEAYHLAAPREDGLGAITAMSRAIAKAGIEPHEIDYVNTHGTGTRLNDKVETMAIKDVLGEHAYDTIITSSKSMTGHLFGAAGAIEAMVCVKTLTDGIISPTINYETPDPECDLDCTPNEARHADVSVAMSNSFGLGGHNATILFRKYNEG